MTPVLLGLRFLLELGALAALGWWGAHAGASPGARLALGLGAPLAAALVWGRFVAPRAPRRLPLPLRLVPEALVFGSATAALAAAGRPHWALAFALLAVADGALLYAGPRRSAV